MTRTRSARCPGSGVPYESAGGVVNGGKAVAFCTACSRTVGLRFTPGERWRRVPHDRRVAVPVDSVRVVLGPTIVADCRVSVRPGPGMHAALWNGVAEAKVHQQAHPDDPLHVYLPRQAARDLAWHARSRLADLKRADADEWQPNPATSAYGRLVRQLDKVLGD